MTCPKNGGQGRLTEVATFRKSAVTEERVCEEFNTVHKNPITNRNIDLKFSEVINNLLTYSSKFPVARGTFLGRMDHDPDMVVLVADWTSAEEKDEFEPSKASHLFRCDNTVHSG